LKGLTRDGSLRKLAIVLTCQRRGNGGGFGAQLKMANY
jgi:hypothetical protein